MKITPASTGSSGAQASGSSSGSGSMVARAGELVEGLTSAEPQRRMTALRHIRDRIIGSKAQKSAFLSAGALPRVLQLLLTEGSTEVQAQCATALGSFAYGSPSGLEQLVSTGGIQGLVGTLSSGEPRVVEAGVRALKLVFAQPEAACVPRDSLMQHDTLRRLVALLRDQSRPDVMEAAAAVLAACCASSAEQGLMNEAGVVDACLDMALCDRRPLQAAALQVFARLLPGNAPACHRLLPCRPLVEVLLRFLRDPEPRIRFAAAGCVTHLSAITATGAAALVSVSVAPGAGGPAPGALGSFGGLGSATGSSEPAASAGFEMHAHLSTLQLLQAARQATLPVLLRLLTDSSTVEMVPNLLAKLLEGSEELQKAAVDADAVRHLAQLLAQQPQPPAPSSSASQAPTPSTSSLPNNSCGDVASCSGQAAAVAGAGGASALLQEGVLRALGNMCLTWNDGRKQLIEAKVLKQVVNSLEHPSDGVRAAAALCVMGLSRSISTLRSSLLETEVAEVLCRLLHDRCVDVQVKVVATLCNLLLEFSSVKEAVLAQGALATVTALVTSGVPELRRNSCCALRNLAFQAEARVRAALMAGLPWRQFRMLLSHPDAAVQEQAVCMLRNLVMDSEQHIRAVLDWAGADLLACLEEKLDPSRCDATPTADTADAAPASASASSLAGFPGGAAVLTASPTTNATAGPTAGPTAASSSAAATVHALYTVANLLTGSEAHKDAVMASNLPALLVHYLRAPAPGHQPVSPELRVAAIWCIINLTWPESGPASNGSAAAMHRIAKLRELGVEECLRVLMEDRDMDVKERAKTAFLQLTSRVVVC